MSRSDDLGHDSVIHYLYQSYISSLESDDFDEPKLLSYIERHQKDLNISLSDEQKVIFEKYNDCLIEHTTNTEKLIFEFAFKLGARLMLETLQK